MAVQDFTTYDETDESADFVVTATKIAVTTMARDADSHVSHDEGVDAIDGDFEFIEEVIIHGSTQNLAQINFCSVANSQESSQDIDTAGGSTQYAQVINLSTTEPNFQVIEIDAGDFGNGSVIAGAEATQYYCEFERDESVGSFGDLELRVYTNVSRTTLLGTSTQTLRTAKRDFRYVYGAQSKNSGGTPQWTGDLENLDLQEVAGAGGVALRHPLDFKRSHLTR